jgi:signal transduction histidine kinase
MMRFGIRKKLLLAFVLVTVLPVVVFFISIGLLVSQLDKDSQLQQLSDKTPAIEDIQDEILNNFSLISDYPVFNQKMQTLTQQYNTHIRITDIYGKVLYDSDNSEEIGKTTKLSSQMYGLSVNESIEGNSRYSFPVILDNQIVGTVFLTYNEYWVVENTVRKILTLLFMCLALGIITFILTMGFSVWLLSRSILVPLKELKEATEKIAEGNLDFTVKYAKNDEIGRFCQTFNAMKDRLKDSLEKQQQEENSRKELVASISHDLRTPITSIKGYVEGLQVGIAKDEATFKQYLAIISNKAEALDRLIEDLFLFSRMDLRRMEMNYRILDSAELLESIFKPLELEFSREPVSLEIKRPIVSETVKADAERITQVINNLVNNSRKFSTNDGRIQIFTIKEENMIWIYIRDNGMGIAEEDIPHIFERFYRSEKSRSRNYGGTGLGLAICKYIVEEHGGNIEVESRVGTGTTFRFSIPVTL